MQGHICKRCSGGGGECIFIIVICVCGALVRRGVLRLRTPYWLHSSSVRICSSWKKALSLVIRVVLVDWAWAAISMSRLPRDFPDFLHSVRRVAYASAAR